MRLPILRGSRPTLGLTLRDLYRQLPRLVEPHSDHYVWALCYHKRSVAPLACNLRDTYGIRYWARQMPQSRRKAGFVAWEA